MGAALGVRVALGTSVGVLLGDAPSDAVRWTVGWVVTVAIGDAQVQPVRIKASRSKQWRLNMATPFFELALC